MPRGGEITSDIGGYSLERLNQGDLVVVEDSGGHCFIADDSAFLVSRMCGVDAQEFGNMLVCMFDPTDNMHRGSTVRLTDESVDTIRFRKLSASERLSLWNTDT